MENLQLHFCDTFESCRIKQGDPEFILWKKIMEAHFRQCDEKKESL